MGINGTAYGVWSTPSGAGGGDVNARALQRRELRAHPGAGRHQPRRGRGRRLWPSARGGLRGGQRGATWGEGGQVYGRRLTGLALSQLPQQISLADLTARAARPTPRTSTIEYDGSFAWVAFRQDFGGGSRALARRLVGSQFESPSVLDLGPGGAAPRVAMTGRGAGLAAASAEGGSSPARCSRTTRSPGPPRSATARCRRTRSWPPTSATARGGLAARRRHARRASRAGGQAVRARDVARIRGPRDGGRRAVRRRGRPPGRLRGRDAPELCGGADAVGRGVRPPARRAAAALVELPAPREAAAALAGRRRPVGPGAVHRLHRRHRDRDGRAPSQLVSPVPVAEGRHRWTVVAVDRRGQQVASKERVLRIDSTRPRLRLQVSGARKRGRRCRSQREDRTPRARGCATSRSISATSRGASRGNQRRIATAPALHADRQSGRQGGQRGPADGQPADHSRVSVYGWERAPADPPGGRARLELGGAPAADGDRQRDAGLVLRRRRATRRSTTRVAHARGAARGGRRHASTSAASRPSAAARRWRAEEEIARVVPLVERARRRARRARLRRHLQAGGRRGGDRRGRGAGQRRLRAARPALARRVRARRAPALVLMHTRVEPKGTLLDPAHYDDVVADVRDFLPSGWRSRGGAACAAEQIVLDPGPDFAKTPAQTVAVLRALDGCTALGRPLLLPSRARTSSARSRAARRASATPARWPRSARRRTPARTSCACTTSRRRRLPRRARRPARRARARARRGLTPTGSRTAAALA